MDAKECLKSILQDINYWLNFAEAKNMALIGFDIALLAISDNCLISLIQCKSLVMYLFLGGLIFPLLSFFPLYSCKIYKHHEDNNLLFYKNIAGYCSTQYWNALKKSYFKKENIEDYEKILQDYSEEIVVNSRITVYKLFMFKIGLFFSITLVILLVILNTIN